MESWLCSVQRKTVNDKLHNTLENRLGESFKLVSDRLEAVHQGLGEMQNLATGVGDLKRVLSNVKARGTWAEVQLGAILEQILAPGTLAAILSSLRMGFQTLAIEQRAAEVWKVLGAVKTEFAKFGGVLDKVRRQLKTASRTIEETGVRTRAMERRLRSVEQLPENEATRILELPAPAEKLEPEQPTAKGAADDDEEIPL